MIFAVCEGYEEIRSPVNYYDLRSSYADWSEMITPDLRSSLAPIPSHCSTSYIYLTLGWPGLFYLRGTAADDAPKAPFISSSFSIYFLASACPDTQYVWRRSEIFLMKSHPQILHYRLRKKLMHHKLYLYDND